MGKTYSQFFLFFKLSASISIWKPASFAHSFLKSQLLRAPLLESAELVTVWDVCTDVCDFDQDNGMGQKD